MLYETETYLSNRALRALQNSLELIADVLHFQIVELWVKNEEIVTCEYSYATESTIQNYPHLKIGYQPARSQSSSILSKMKELVSVKDKCYWSNEIHSESRLAPLEFRSKTELAYLILPDGNEKAERSNILLLGVSLDLEKFSEAKLKFLTGIGCAIATAFYEFEHDNTDDEGLLGEELELDEKKFSPSKPLQSASNLLLLSKNLLDPNDPASDMSLGVWGKNISAANLILLQEEDENFIDEDDIDVDIENEMSYRSMDEEGGIALSPPTMDVHSSAHATENSSSHQGSVIEINNNPSRSPPIAQPALVIPKLTIPLSNSNLTLNIPSGMTPRSARGRVPVSARSAVGLYSARSELSTARSVAPTWEPTSSFAFPVSEISPRHFIPDDLTMDAFSEIKHLADGGNSNIYVCKWNQEKVVVKMIKEKQQVNPVTVHEFDLEHGMLCRIQHPNIIKILGAGRQPRRFIVLEYLAGGTLNTLLAKNQTQPGLTSKLFRKPSFTYQELLTRGKEIADAFDYLHRRVHEGACIIHRDLKPDNIGFGADGSIKLFDFGLVTCVRSRARATDSYEMTGFTGSLRYMAPEVALCSPYSEKVDVYSFGILLWQMARDRVPFKGLNKEEFMHNVVMDGERPKLDSSWPAEFSKLLTSCWQRDAVRRPSFEQISKELDRLLLSVRDNNHSRFPVAPTLKQIGKTKTESVVSGITAWF